MMFLLWFTSFFFTFLMRNCVLLWGKFSLNNWLTERERFRNREFCAQTFCQWWKYSQFQHSFPLSPRSNIERWILANKNFCHQRCLHHSQPTSTRKTKSKVFQNRFSSPFSSPDFDCHWADVVRILPFSKLNSKFHEWKSCLVSNNSEEIGTKQCGESQQKKFWYLILELLRNKFWFLTNLSSRAHSNAVEKTFEILNISFAFNLESWIQTSTISLPGGIWFSWETESKQIHQSDSSVPATFSASRLIRVTKTFLVATERKRIDFFMLHYSWQPNLCKLVHIVEWQSLSDLSMHDANFSFAKKSEISVQQNLLHALSFHIDHRTHHVTSLFLSDMCTKWWILPFSLSSVRFSKHNLFNQY